MTSSLSELLIGVAVAIIAFVTQQIVVFVIDGIRFRRRLRADISLIVEGFRNWSRPANVVIEKRDDPVHPSVSMSLIWDNGYESMNDLYANSSHLSPELFARVARFYDAAGRFDEIRRSYNSSVIETVKTTEKAKWAVVLNCHLKDIQNVVGEIVQSGETLLTSLAALYSMETAMDQLSSVTGPN